jgi:hypothetical protein
MATFWTKIGPGDEDNKKVMTTRKVMMTMKGMRTMNVRAMKAMMTTTKFMTTMKVTRTLGPPFSHSLSLTDRSRRLKRTEVSFKLCFNT